MHSILITGASRGIGQALARRLAAPERRLLLTGRDSEGLRATAEGLAGEITLLSADLQEPEDRRRLVNTAIEQSVEVLINNAGTGAFSRIDDVHDRALQDLIETNLLAPMRLTRDLLPHLRHRPHAQIVNIGSTFGSIGFPGQATYCASKFALKGFTQALRREVAGDGITVQYIAPRATQTTFNSAAVDQLNRALGNRSDTPKAVAEAIARYLKKPAGDYYLGWPEKMFVRLNAMMPGILDRYFRKQQAVIERALRAGEQ